MQNNFEPLNLKNANRHLDWLINKTGSVSKTSNITKPKKTKVSLWSKVLNILTRIF